MRLATPALLLAALFVLFPAGVAYSATGGCARDETCVGTSADDRLKGTNGEDEILARGGRDSVDARGGSDVVHGGPGADGNPYGNGGLYGDSPKMSANSIRDGADTLYGDDGRDVLYGFGGSDLLIGGAGADYVFAGEFRVEHWNPVVASSKNPGVDVVMAGAGEDHIESIDHHKDVVNCGGGKDAVWFDEGLDIIAPNCELKNITHG